MRAFWHNCFQLSAGGQAMLETALVLPIFILFFIGIIEFGTRAYNQTRVAMAARHAAWLGVNGRYDDIESEVKRFFGQGADVQVEKKREDLGLIYHNALIDYGLFAYTTGYTSHPLDKNVFISLTYRRQALPYAPPGSSEGLEFLWRQAVNYPVTAARGDTATWQKMDFLTVAWFFLASGVWLDILIDIGIGAIIEGISEKFGPIGSVFTELFNELIERWKDVGPLKCD